MQRMSQSDWLERLSILSMFMANDGPHNKQLQRRLAGLLMPPEAMEYLADLPAAEQAIYYVLTEHQVLNLAKCALRLAPRAPATRHLPARDVSLTVGQAALITMDELARAGGPLLSADDRDLAAREVVRSSIREMAFAHIDRFDRLLERYYALFLKPANGMKWKARGREFEVAGAFEELSGGLRLVDFARGGFWLAANYTQVTALSPDGPTLAFHPDPWEWLCSTPLSKRDICLLLSLLTQTADEAIHALAAEEELTGFAPLSFTAFRRRPLIHLDSGRTVPVSLRFLQERVTSGIFWDIFDHMKETYGFDTACGFAGAFGGALQSYATDLLIKAFHPFGAATPSADEEYVAEKGRVKRAPDFVVSMGREMIWFEVTSLRVRQPTRVSGALEGVAGFESDVIGTPERPGKLFDKFLQISKRASDFREVRRGGNPLLLAGKSWQDVKRIWPVVVTLDSFPMDTFMWDYLQGKIKEWRARGAPELLADDKFAALQIMNVGNLEQICELGVDCGSFLNLLLMRDRLGRLDESWDNFLYYEFYQKRPPPSPRELEDRLAESEVLRFLKEGVE